ncbi:hypothetical protein FAI40_08305 [Acetobacteraceae bacterium]|nr:hypothetical protein FAI40_08305 [Acetobacteraceae bacterium]
MKKLLLLGLIAPLSFSLTACGKSEEEQKAACIEKMDAHPEEFYRFAKDPICSKVTNADIDEYDRKHPKVEAKVPTSRNELLSISKEKRDAIANYKGQSLGNPDDPNF